MTTYITLKDGDVVTTDETPGSVWALLVRAARAGCAGVFDELTFPDEAEGNAVFQPRHVWPSQVAEVSTALAPWDLQPAV